MGMAKFLRRWGIPIVVAVVVGGLLWRYGAGIRGQLLGALLWIDGLGFWGPLLFIALYALITVLFLPASIFTLGAGAVYGVGSGALYVIIGATIGANLAFLIGRYLAQERVQAMMAGIPTFAAVNRAIAKGGWKVVGLIRLSPAFPFNVLNYALGLTPISLVDNIIGTAGIIPGTFMYVYIGSIAGELALMGQSTELDPQTQQLQWVLRIVGLIATIAVTVYVTRLARQALKDVQQEQTTLSEAES
ncbi:MAG: hypothetical protein OHK0012_00320 [Synechococcales cyanobacterium]